MKLEHKLPLGLGGNTSILSGICFCGNSCLLGCAYTCLGPCTGSCSLLCGGCGSSCKVSSICKNISG